MLYDLLIEHYLHCSRTVNEEAEMFVSPEGENASSFMQLHLLPLLFVLLLLFLSEIKGQNPVSVSMRHMLYHYGPQSGDDNWIIQGSS